MAKVLVTESYLEDIGDAIRAKLETQDTYKPSQMANAIGQISGGATLITKSITENGTYDASDDEADGYSSVTVDVAGGGTALILLDKELTQSSGGSISIDETVTISEAGDYYIICYGYVNNVEVYINGVLQSNNFDNSSDYYHAYSQKKTLSVGDIVRVNITSSGKSNLRAFIAAV